MLRHFVDARAPGDGGRGLRPGRTVWPRIACQRDCAGPAAASDTRQACLLIDCVGVNLPAPWCGTKLNLAAASAARVERRTHAHDQPTRPKAPTSRQIQDQGAGA
jgi:hypothetical protein